MGKGIWQRCPKCGRWCSASKENFVGRIGRSYTIGDKEYGNKGSKIGEVLKMEDVGKTIGRIINALDTNKHITEILFGPNYLFYCECGCKFGTYNDEMDITRQIISIKNASEVEKNNFIKKTQKILTNEENKVKKAALYKLLAYCYYYFYNDSANALIEINKSLGLFDDKRSHILKGLFMGKVETPDGNYDKINELLNIHDCDCPSYIDNTTIDQELRESEKNYVKNFLSIPISQRKFMVITSEYIYLPDSFKVIKYDDTELSGIKFKNGFANNNAIYVCHPYKSIYYPSNSYQTDLINDQINELRELLQCLGAKSITIENSISIDIDINKANNRNAEAGGKYEDYGGNVSSEHKASTSTMESMIQKMLIDDEFSCNPDTYPYVPEGLVWYDHMEDWQLLSRMRLLGETKYSITFSSKLTRIVNENEANQVNTDFKVLAAKGNFKILDSTELKASETQSHEWKLAVEFYPLSNYKKKI